MAENKKYFYMRLKENFFNSPELIAVESMENGYCYSNILLKMYLLSLRGEGRLMAGTIPYSPEMLAKATGHDAKTVREAINFFSDVELIEILDTGAIYMLDIQNFVGQSSTEADRKAVNNLNDRQRNCIDLIYFHSKTAPEIGKLLDIPAQSVYAAKRDGIRNIRKGRYMPVLSEIYYGTRNYYRGSGLASFRNTGSSLPEMELLRKEQFDQQCQAAIKRISRERKLPC